MAIGRGAPLPQVPFSLCDAQVREIHDKTDKVSHEAATAAVQDFKNIKFCKAVCKALRIAGLLNSKHF